MRKSALYIVTALLLVTSCNEALMEPQKTGSISLLLSSDKEVTVDTKAEAEVDCSNFLVDIYGETFLGQQYSTPRYVFSQMPEAVEIPFGYYHVSAQNCLPEAAEEGFGSVHYYGESEQIDVLSDETATVSVVCSMVNGKVTLTLDESFLDDFTDVYAELAVGGRTVRLESDNALGNDDVYFNVSSTGSDLVYRIYGTVGKGTEQEKSLCYTNASSPLVLSPAKWAKITIKSNHNGIIGPGVSVDDEMGNESYPEIIDPEGGTVAEDGDMLPVLYVDTQMDDATVIDCVIDVL